jgi:asparagine synthase (glutamine-hydrolysing)
MWLDGRVGFGHALLRTSDDTEPCRQPATLDGITWITADARIDGRGDLLRQLEACGRTNLRTADDVLLVLHAYHAWGEGCVEKLLGDYAFAIWDGRARRLFCARDHFGVKPFYYAAGPDGLVFSNTLSALRTEVEDRALNDLAVADFLLFGINQDETSTIFAGIKRLPPAHTLTFADGMAQTHRYWSLPIDGRVRFRRSEEYLERFCELLEQAVSDRLRSSSVGIWMSGGLDSTSLTAVARRLQSRHEEPSELHAHTIVYDTLIPDDERRYAHETAAHLGIENHVFVADGYRPFEGWESIARFAAEPTGDPLLHMRARQMGEIATHSRILLSGEGGDELLCSSHALDVARRTTIGEFAADVARSLVVHRRRPPLGLRALARRSIRSVPPYPEWMNADLTARLKLRERWELVHGIERQGIHPVRPEAHSRLCHAPWSWYFETSDPGVTGLPLEIRYPYLDLRLVNYALSIPPIPWCADKHILRVAMKGLLPDAVRLRRKTPLASDPLHASLEQARGWPRCAAAPELASYVNTSVAPITNACNGTDAWLNLRPVCLSHWFNHAHVHLS